MQRFLKFKLARECREIAINPDKVLYVCHYENGASALHFSKDCYVRVQGTLEDVILRLETAAGEGRETVTHRDDARLTHAAPPG